MDDAVLVEPLLGLRPWVCKAVYESGVKKMLGEQAINMEKDRIEGEFRTCQTCWGLDFDTEAGTVRIPERRITKGAHLLADPAYEPGNKEVTLLQLQRLRGTAQSWVPVLPSLKAELKAIDVFLGPAKELGVVRCKAGLDEERSGEDL